MELAELSADVKMWLYVIGWLIGTLVLWRWFSADSHSAEERVPIFFLGVLGGFFWPILLVIVFYVWWISWGRE